MVLTEEHRIKKCENRALYQEIDTYCYLAKNLTNAVQYLISQCFRIHRKLKEGEILDSWEKGLIYPINCAIWKYNNGRKGKKLKYIDEQNGFIADAYFLSWYMKTLDVYKNMPYATCSQICIQEKCREWKSFYQALSAYRKDRHRFMGCPRKPRYLDPMTGRGRLVITSQNFTIDEDGYIRMPKFLEGIRLRARHTGIRQIRIRTEKTEILIQITYEQKEQPLIKDGNVMGIDLGVGNLVTISLASEDHPVIINGRPLKSINRYYNKKKAMLQKQAKKSNHRYTTNRMERLTQKRNRKIKDYLHKTSRKVIEIALQTKTGLIVIGNNRGWKQHVALGNRTNQTFVSIPYKTLIDMICYKARLAGIDVRVVNESYTSGTSYLDGEKPDKQCYDNARRISRGVFRSNSGKLINADVNAAYQIIKAAGINNLEVKENETVTRVNVA